MEANEVPPQCAFTAYAEALGKFCGSEASFRARLKQIDIGAISKVREMLNPRRDEIGMAVSQALIGTFGDALGMYDRDVCCNLVKSVVTSYGTIGKFSRRQIEKVELFLITLRLEMQKLSEEAACGKTSDAALAAQGF